jgi:hypothetical protein
MPLTPRDKIAVVQLAMQKKHNDAIESKKDSIEVIEDVVKHTEGMQTLIVRVDGDVESITGNEGNDGKDAPPVDEDAIVDRVYAKIRVPLDGKDVDEDVVVERVLSMIPTPKDGKDADEKRIISSVLSKIDVPLAPVKGTDYYTDDEVAELIAKIKAETKADPITGSLVRDLLEDLPTGERLHIKNLDGLDEFKKSISPEQKVIGGGTRFLSRLADVNVEGIADGEFLVWSESEDKFVAGSGGSGSGDVTKVGTPVNNQIGVWTGDGTIEGDVDLTWDTTTNTLGVGMVGLDARVQVHAVKSDASDGLLLEALDGTDVGVLGVANTANVSWYGSHNFSTATQDTIAAFTGAGKTLGSLATATYPSLTELALIKGLTASSSELNILDGATISTAELNYVDGVTSAIQTQLDTKAPLASPTFTGTVTLPKTLEIQDTSADHQYVLAVSELSADRTVTLPLLTSNDEFVFKDHTQTLTNKSIVATQLTGTAYTFPANNTNGTASMTLIHYEAHPVASYGGTITWDGTAPTNLSSTEYTWSRVGDTVNLTINASYSTSGNSNTTVTFTLPTDCPSPATIAGSGDAADEVICPCTGFYLNTITTSPPTGLRGWLSRNSANDGYIISVKGASLGAKFVTVNVMYRAA